MARSTATVVCLHTARFVITVVYFALARFEASVVCHHRARFAPQVVYSELARSPTSVVLASLARSSCMVSCRLRLAYDPWLSNKPRLSNAGLWRIVVARDRPFVVSVLSAQIGLGVRVDDR